jgi:carbon-monoxide dehydrogenase small subunit
LHSGAPLGMPQDTPRPAQKPALVSSANPPVGARLRGGDSLVKVSITVNGTKTTRDVEPRLLLVHYLRESLALTGTHIGCDTSSCGACTVMLNGMAVKSCTVLAVQADGGTVKTVEGLATNGQLHPIQEGFWEEHGLQCGFCTPGMMMTALQIIERHPKPTDEQIRHGLEGNLCRCTGYQHIVNAIQYAARKMAEAGAPATGR